jgi:hypothetical protein
MLIGHKPLQIPEVIKFINQQFPQITWHKLMEVKHSDLELAWRAWLLASPYNKITGLEQFTHSGFCPGTTDAFGEFIARYPHRRVRISRSDFVLTKILSRSWGHSLEFVEDGPLESNDCMIMSMPFSGNGDRLPNQDALLDQADQLEIPVFVDGAYFGISQDIEYPLHRTCIKDFTVSLSKNMVGDPLRLGIRFTKDAVDDGITAGLIGSDIFDRFGAYLTVQLLDNFSHSWLMQKYFTKSQQICKELGLTPTKTFTLALGPESMTDYKRGDYVRICITDELISAS